MKQNTTSHPTLSGPELLKIVDDLVREEKHLEAARLLRTIKDPSIFTDTHRKILNKAAIIEYV